MSTECKLDIHKEVWDLGGTLYAEFKNPAGEPCLVIHENQELHVIVTLKLTGRILNYLCNTQICVTVAFESCGKGPEEDYHAWKTVNPCVPGGDTYTFDFLVPAGSLPSGHCGKQYEVCITLGSKDCCGKVGFIFGTCKDINITVLPADVN